jgi:hypothetical protein
MNHHIAYNPIIHLYTPESHKHPSRSTGSIHSIGRILRLWIDSLHMRAHTSILPVRHIIVFIILIMLVLTTVAGLRKVLGARVARNGVAGRASDDVAVEEQVDRFERDAWVEVRLVCG